ncbi:MAG: carboxypeptidase regulatory-like domain-containing protein, partial [Acidobacteria bacterium]|nr:carboxypeptidase regulatory-like domain-containing protein [Acidobacteriota bacterium]
MLDRDGAPLPGAIIGVANPALGLEQGAVTDARGEFRIVPLPPGRGYRLRVSFPGMATVTLPDVDLPPSRISAVQITLFPESQLRERVRIVEKADVVNLDETTTQTTFSSEFIDALPILGRNYQDVLALAPGVTDVDGDGNVNIHGARDTDVVTLVDGVSTDDPLTGRRGQELNLESIQEIEVKTSGFSAEFGRAQGGFVNIITRSGGNEFQGNFKFFWRGNVLDGDGAGIDDPVLHGGLSGTSLRDLEFNDFTPFVSASGPLRKDRAWFYTSAEYIQKEDPVNAQTQAFVRGMREKRLFGKLSWDVAEGHKLMFTATFDPQEYDNEGLDSFTALESGYTLKLGGRNLVLKETAIFNPSVFLETTVQDFVSSPSRIPTTGPDSNGNGILYFDRNGNRAFEVSERDSGDNWDDDGAWDVFEPDSNGNGKWDPRLEDLDGDGRRTAARVGCEGETREDRDCDGNLDRIPEDANGNGILDGDEDLDGDHRLDPGTEDRNRNRILDDRPRPSPADEILDYRPDGTLAILPPTYPYGAFRPLSGDSDYQDDQGTSRVSGPNYLSYDLEFSRFTLRQDLTVYVPDFHGSHDLKIGAVLQRERFGQSTVTRQILKPLAREEGMPPQLGADLPTEPAVFNQAGSLTLGAYIHDGFKALPNLSFGFGLRFDREATDSFGYTSVDPVAERHLYDRLWNLGGGERGQNDALVGNGDEIASQGFCADPIVHCPSGPGGNPAVEDLFLLTRIAPSRLTQHHSTAVVTAESLRSLFPDAIVTDEATGELILDRELLRDQGSATFQERESFRLTNNNLAPRLSVSWDPFADARTKVFVNWGRFFDKLFLSALTPEEGPDFATRSYMGDPDGITGAGTPNNRIGPTLSKAPPSSKQVDRGLQTPFSDELTIGFEREIAPEVGLRLTYINRKYRRQLQDRDINHSLRYKDGRPRDDIGALLTNITNTGVVRVQRNPDGFPDLYIHNFFFSRIDQIANVNEADYSGIEVQLSRRLSRKWQMDASYTYSRAVGNAESFDSELGDDPSVTDLEFGYLSYDMRHQVKVNAVAFLPRDWQLGGVLAWHSGLPYSVISRVRAFNNFDYLQDRTFFGYVRRQSGEPTTFIPVRRNSERNDAAYSVNLRASKAFVLGRLSSKLFITADNLLNSDALTIFTENRNAPETA